MPKRRRRFFFFRAARSRSGSRPIEFLSTKLYVPPVRPTLIPWPRLYDQLNPTTVNRLVLVSVPAGYGKTMLVSSWLAENKCPVSWLSLDERDNDLVRLLQYLTRGLAQIIPAIKSNRGIG